MCKRLSAEERRALSEEHVRELEDSYLHPTGKGTCGHCGLPFLKNRVVTGGMHGWCWQAANPTPWSDLCAGD